MKILIVDDIDMNRILLNKILKKSGFQTELFEDGFEVVKYYKNLTKKDALNINLILMDIRMPVMDGVAATKQLKKSGYKGPVVAVTASWPSTLKSHFNDVLHKPVSAKSLLLKVSQLTEK